MRTERPLVLGGRYRVDEHLAQGGMADVYVGTDTQLGRRVAVKVLRDTAHEKRFTDEAMTLARLNHPGLVSVYDAGVSDGVSWLVMELVEGTSLAQLGAAPLAPGRVATIGAALAEALTCVHDNGVIHRDVKPANVLLRDDGRVVLTDFGIARLVELTDTHTEAGTTIGTAAYLSPEQVRGEPLTTAVDSYSLGLVLLELLTGRRAYPGNTVESAMARLHQPPEIPDLPEGWSELLGSMTSLDPGRRAPMREVAASLRALEPGTTRSTSTKVLTGVVPAVEELPTRHVPLVDPVARRTPLRDRLPLRSEHPALLALAGLLLLVLVVLVVAGASGDPGTEPTPVPSGVPSRLQQPLQDLHDAVEGR